MEKRAVSKKQNTVGGKLYALDNRCYPINSLAFGSCE